MLKKYVIITSLLLVLFIDGLGLSIVLPLSTEMFLSSKESILPISTSLSMRNFIYGVNLVCFSIGMFFGAPILGELSDKFGRKKILFVALLGTLLGYCLSGIAVLVKSPLLFLSGRLIDGLTAGSVPIAQACMSDISSEKEKASYLGYTLFAITAGYILGPLISNFFVIETELLGSGLSLPFFFTALLTLFSMFLLSYLEDSPVINSDKKVNIFASLNTFKLLDRVGNLKVPLLGFLLFQLGWTLYFQFLPVYLKFRLLENETAYILAIIGLGMSISFCFLVGLMQKIAGQIFSIIIFSLIICFSIIFQQFLYSNNLLLIAFSFIGAIGYGIGYSFLLAYLSLNANKSVQGLIMGLAASISALASGVTAILGAFVINYSIYSINLISAIFFVLCVLCVILEGYLNGKPKFADSKAN